MATQSYIIARENIIIEAIRFARSGDRVPMECTRRALREGLEAYAYEQDLGGYSANRDLWGTFGDNVEVLGRFCPELRHECRSVAIALGVHT